MKPVRESTMKDMKRPPAWDMKPARNFMLFMSFMVSESQGG